jgi:hypothetical protein
MGFTEPDQHFIATWEIIRTLQEGLSIFALDRPNEFITEAISAKYITAFTPRSTGGQLASPHVNSGQTSRVRATRQRQQSSRCKK